MITTHYKYNQKKQKYKKRGVKVPGYNAYVERRRNRLKDVRELDIEFKDRLYLRSFYKDLAIYNEEVKELSNLGISSQKSNYIPLRFNQAGVMPIILTTGVLVIPTYINSLGFLPLIAA